MPENDDKPLEDIKPEPPKEPEPAPEPPKEPEKAETVNEVDAKLDALTEQVELMRGEISAVQEKLGATEALAAMAAELTILTEAIREIKETDQKPEKENWLTKKWIG